MQDPNLSDTQPTRVRPAQGESVGATPPRREQPSSKPPSPTGPRKKSQRAAQKPPRPVGKSPRRFKPGQIDFAHKDKIWRWLWALTFILLLGFFLLAGGLAGYNSARQARKQRQAGQAAQLLQEQYELGLKDLEDGQYEVARQRFEYILKQDPNYPGVTDKLAQVMAVLYVTATPTPLPPSATPSPTPDLRPVQDLFTNAVQLVANQEWNTAIDMLTSLRKASREFMAARVDGLLYLSLRNRGVDKILKEGNLEGGIYDLSLAERFGPIDVEANQAREWARLYMFGLAFWEVFPERAVFFFGQLATAAPYLSDASGWTATDRYRAALIQYGDLLAGQSNWCEAQKQYELALSIRADAMLQEALQKVTLLCIGATPTLPVTHTTTPTPTATGGVPTVPGASPTPTSTQPLGSPTPTATATTGGPAPTATPTATPTSVAPVETPTPTQTAPLPSDTPYPGPAPASAIGQVDHRQGLVWKPVWLGALAKLLWIAGRFFLAKFAWQSLQASLQ